MTDLLDPYSSPPDGVMTWKSLGAAVPDSRQARSSQIEMASYVLLALYKRGSVVEGLELMKWLSRQRTHLGGFGSTQVTRLIGSVPLYLCFSSFCHIEQSPSSLSVIFNIWPLNLSPLTPSQDTVIALQALACYAAFSGANAIDISIRVSSPTSLSQNLFSINSTSYMLQQGQEVSILNNTLHSGCLFFHYAFLVLMLCS